MYGLVNSRTTHKWTHSNNKLKYRYTLRQRDTADYIYRHTDFLITDPDIQTQSQTNRHTDLQIYRPRQTETQIHKHTDRFIR